MGAIDYEGIAAEARNKAINDSADRVVHAGTHGCEILKEISGMSLKDIQDVFAAAQKKGNEEFTKTKALPYLTYDTEPYSRTSSGYGYMPDSSIPELTATVKALRAGSNGFEKLVSFDTAKWNSESGPKNNTCTDR